MQISDLQIGKSYTNHDIAEIFKCSNMGGMRRSRQTNSLVLITKPERCCYQDSWSADRETLIYTGMGKIGDQDLNYSQNKTLNESRINGVGVYLFESPQSNMYTYYGQYELADDPFNAVEPGADGKLRTVIKFPLKRKTSHSQDN